MTSDVQRRWALELWDAGALSTDRTLAVLEVRGLTGLHAWAAALGVRIRPGRLVREARAAEVPQRGRGGRDG